MLQTNVNLIAINADKMSYTIPSRKLFQSVIKYKANK
jgi:hypothetical protein